MTTSISIKDFITASDLGLQTTNKSLVPSLTERQPLSEIDMLQDGLELIKQWEGLELEAYPDPATNSLPITIGYGAGSLRQTVHVELGNTTSPGRSFLQIYSSTNQTGTTHCPH